MRCRAAVLGLLLAGAGGLGAAGGAGAAVGAAGGGEATAAAAAASAPPTAVALVPVPDAAALADPEWVQAGRKRFVQVCAYCHGVRGDAGKTAPFQGRRGWDPQVIHDVIARGRVNGANVMPSWQQSIPDEMIWKLVAYVKSLSADAPVPAASSAATPPTAPDSAATANAAAVAPASR